ncbi:hypothetical protein KKE33_01085 [Patescibacteria group bacterium]|nr:hypothetical protein [Patescibacteria group bacterium]
MTRATKVVMLAALTVVLSILYPFPVKAEGLSWGGAQIQLVLAAEREVAQKTGVRTQLAGFFLPSSDVKFAFFYLGPTFTIKRDAYTLWLSPQVGMNWGWYPEGENGAITSMWAILSFLENKFSVFAEAETYFGLNGSSAEFYGYFSFDGFPLEYLNIGVHGEQVNDGVTFGPHVGLAKAPFGCELGYFFDPENGTHAPRFLLALRF